MSPDDPMLLVEDTPEDYEATVRAFRKAGLTNPIHRCTDGDDALDYLHQRGAYASAERAPRPSLILLDLNLPGTDGKEVLVEIKTNSDLRSIPVIMFSSSSDPRDIERCYAAGANSYVPKPMSVAGLFDTIVQLKEFWFRTALLPGRDDCQ